MFQVSRLNKIE